jgi:hypothetical protein
MSGGYWGATTLSVIVAAIVVGEVIRSAFPGIGFVFAVVGLVAVPAVFWIGGLVRTLLVVDDGSPVSAREGTPAPSGDQHVLSGALSQVEGGA